MRSKCRISLNNGRFDVLSTASDGVMSNIRTIHLGNVEAGKKGPVFNIHIDGIPEKVAHVEKEFGRNKVRTYAFADFNSGLERAGYASLGGAGEVSVVVVIEANVPVSTMARAAITANEAITASLQDFGLRYGGINASGLVKQDITIVCKRSSDVSVRGAGNHSKMGELIGASVIEAVKQSAHRNGMQLKKLTKLTEIMERAGVSREVLFRMSNAEEDTADLNKFEYSAKYRVASTAVLHILDCIEWGLIPEEEGTRAGHDIMKCCFDEESDSGCLKDALSKQVAAHLFEKR